VALSILEEIAKVALNLLNNRGGFFAEKNMLGFSKPVKYPLS
jgi:hypothetical protein